jgi:hypothetical protein
VPALPHASVSLPPDPMTPEPGALVVRPQGGDGRAGGVSGGAAPPPGTPLGNITGFAAKSDSFSLTGSQITPSESARLARAERFELQAVARAILPGHRIKGCLLHRRHGASLVEVRRSRASGLAYYAGLQVCGRGAVCPLCGARIAEHNCREIQTALDVWKGRGGVPALITFTMPHYRSQRLSDNLAALLAAYRGLTGHGSYREVARAAKLQHSIRSTEITWGHRNGYHPHLHVLGFFGSGYGASGFPERLPLLWLAELKRHIDVTNADHVLERGVRFQLGFTAGAEYVSKVGQAWGLAEEVSKANRKKGRGDHFSPLQLLCQVRDGAPWAAAVFQEYAEVSHGLHFLQWSRDMRKDLGLAAEKSDEEIAAGVDQHDAVLAALTPAEWRAVRAGGWQARVRLVELADYDEDAAAAYVAHLVERFGQASAATVGSGDVAGIVNAGDGSCIPAEKRDGL